MLLAALTKSQNDDLNHPTEYLNIPMNVWLCNIKNDMKRSEFELYVKYGLIFLLQLKRNAFLLAKECEKTSDQIRNARDGKGKQTSEKDISKVCPCDH